MVKRPFAVAMMLLATATFTYAAAPEIQSGLQPGERVPAYHVNDCTGPSAGKSLCYRCKFGNRPVVNIFTRDMTPEVVKLISQIDKKVEANQSQQMSAFVVHLTNDTDASSSDPEKSSQRESPENSAHQLRWRSGSSELQNRSERRRYRHDVG